MRRVAPAILLFFLAPLVAEFLLGDFTVEYLIALVLLAPMYGGGAILIREVTRRTGRGWPSIVLLALAYGVFEEGITTQSLFDPDYAHAHLLDHGFVPALGIAVPWTLFVLTLHTVWSISVPIALVEGLTVKRGTAPWLRTPGLVVAAVLFGVGSVATVATSYATDHFLAPWPALAVVVIVVVALAVLALRLPPVPGPAVPAGDAGAVGAGAVGAGAGAVSAGGVGTGGVGAGGVGAGGSAVAAPSAWVPFVAALVAGGAFMLARELPTPAGLALLIAVIAAVPVTVRAWSRRTGWGARHRLALAGGALLTYAWHGFLTHPIEGDGPVITPVSHVVFALAALGLLALELRALEPRTPRTPVDRAVEPVHVPDPAAGTP